MFFGYKLKEIRLKRGYGLRVFADKMKMRCSTLSDIEHGYSPPPDNHEWILKVIEKLDLEQTDQEAVELGYSCSQHFIMQKMPEHIIPVHARTTDGSRYTSKDLEKLRNFLDEITEQHNKKVDKYNVGYKG